MCSTDSSTLHCRSLTTLPPAPTQTHMPAAQPLSTLPSVRRAASSCYTQGELRYAGSKWQGNTAVETFVCSKSRSQKYISTPELALARALLA